MTTAKEQDTDRLIITRENAPGRSYDILMSADVESEPFAPILSNIPYPQNSCTADVSQVRGAGFYKAKVNLP